MKNTLSTFYFLRKAALMPFPKYSKMKRDQNT